MEICEANTTRPGLRFDELCVDKCEEISTHESIGDARAYVLEGVGEYTVDGVKHEVKAGEALVMPARKPHAVYAKKPFKWLLTVIFPTEE